MKVQLSKNMKKKPIKTLNRKDKGLKNEKESELETKKYKLFLGGLSGFTTAGKLSRSKLRRSLPLLPKIWRVNRLFHNKGPKNSEAKRIWVCKFQNQKHNG